MTTLREQLEEFKRTLSAEVGPLGRGNKAALDRAIAMAATYQDAMKALATFVGEGLIDDVFPGENPNLKAEAESQVELVWNLLGPRDHREVDWNPNDQRRLSVYIINKAPTEPPDLIEGVVRIDFNDTQNRMILEFEGLPCLSRSGVRIEVEETPAGKVIQVYHDSDYFYPPEPGKRRRERQPAPYVMQPAYGPDDPDRCIYTSYEPDDHIPNGPRRCLLKAGHGFGHDLREQRGLPAGER